MTFTALLPQWAFVPVAGAWQYFQAADSGVDTNGHSSTDLKKVLSLTSAGRRSHILYQYNNSISPREKVKAPHYEDKYEDKDESICVTKMKQSNKWIISYDIFLEVHWRNTFYSWQKLPNVPRTQVKVRERDSERE